MPRARSSSAPLALACLLLLPGNVNGVTSPWWFLAPAIASTCDAVCGVGGDPCNVDAMNAINSEVAMYAVVGLAVNTFDLLVQLGLTCESFGTPTGSHGRGPGPVYNLLQKKCS
ncbi:hypothetical protein T492DRAFT_849889 [Pavlovales sp. CCMP2436]|nr:hypothetical protein T492DRAFT_849889 [Pavlovales sp. CCMP2436]